VSVVPTQKVRPDMLLDMGILKKKYIYNNKIKIKKNPKSKIVMIHKIFSINYQHYQGKYSGR
jgi:hypothetical protein